MTKSTILRGSALLAALSFFFSPTQAQSTQPAAKWLDFLATTDIHGHLEASQVPRSGGRQGPAIERGGMALLSGYVANARRNNPGRVVLVDSGDALQGTLLSNLGEGAAVVQAFNALGYAAMAVGNHEFDFGPVGPQAIPHHASDDPRGALRARVAEAKFAWLSSNVLDERKVPLGISAIKPFVVINVDGIRVGIVGGSTMETLRTTIRPNLVGLHVEPLDEHLAQAAEQARAAGATVVVAIVHAGGGCQGWRAANESDPGNLAGCMPQSELFQLARSLAELARKNPLRSINAIFGGHTHQAVSAVVAGIPVAQSFADGLGLAHISIEVDALSGHPTGRFHVDPPSEICSAFFAGGLSCNPLHTIVKRSVPAVYLGKPVVADAKMAQVIAPFIARAAEQRSAPVGVALDAPCLRVYGGESPLGNLVADVIREATHADVGIMNGGGIREAIPAGQLTYGALFQALPFENRLATLRLTGRELKQVLRANFANDKGALLVSGIHAQARCHGADLALKITFDDGRALEDDHSYLIGMNDFLALGGDDFALITPSALKVDEDGPVLRDVVAQALLRRGKKLHVGDPKIFDPRRPRLELPTERPVRCSAY